MITTGSPRRLPGGVPTDPYVISHTARQDTDSLKVVPRTES